MALPCSLSPLAPEDRRQLLIGSPGLTASSRMAGQGAVEADAETLLDTLERGTEPKNHVDFKM